MFYLLSRLKLKASSLFYRIYKKILLEYKETLNKISK